MPLNFIQPTMTSGLLQTSNNLSELNTVPQLEVAYVNIGLTNLLPIGTVLPFAGSTAPVGWLLCNGQAVDRTIAADLFAAIGTTYGVGNGTTTFNLPDLRGRVVAGKDTATGSANRLTTANSGIDSKVLGAAGGAEAFVSTVSAAAGGDVDAVEAIEDNVQPTIVLNYIIRTDFAALEVVP